MPQTVFKTSDDPFEGLQLPVNAWKALEEADITSLEQLKTVAPQLEQIPCIGPETAQLIKDRLDRLAVRRTVRVRLVFPKRPHRTSKAGGTKPTSRRKLGSRTKPKRSI